MQILIGVFFVSVAGNIAFLLWVIRKAEKADKAEIENGE